MINTTQNTHSNILIDCDDTIVSLLAAWINELNKKYNLSVKEDDIMCWDMCKAFPELKSTEIFEPLITPGFWSKVLPRDDAQKYIPILQNEGYNIYIVTATDYRNFSEKTSNLILKHFPTIDKHNIISCFNKQLLNGDILIDDNPNNLIGGSYKKILFNSPHNRFFKTYPEKNSDIYRANNWCDCYNLIHYLLEV